VNQITGSTLSNVNTKEPTPRSLRQPQGAGYGTASALRLRTAINPLEAEQGKLGVETAHYRDLLKQNVITQDEFNAHQVITSKRLRLRPKHEAGRHRRPGDVGRDDQPRLPVERRGHRSGAWSIPVHDLGPAGRPDRSDFRQLQVQHCRLSRVRREVAWKPNLANERHHYRSVAAAAAVAALALQYDKLQVSSQRALIGAGERTGTTVSDLNKFTEQNSGISGTGLSNKEARALGEDLTKTGEIVVSQLHGMSDAVVGFSNQTGQSMEDARKAFVGFARSQERLGRTSQDLRCL
jgi:hypothetical protein